MVIFPNDVRSPETSEDAPFLCELFALSSRLPATVSLSLETLAEHGGGSAPHADGWGIAYYREDDARLIKDTSAAHDSDWVRFVQSRGLSSTTIISHIRKARSPASDVILLPWDSNFRRRSKSTRRHSCFNSPIGYAMV